MTSETFAPLGRKDRAPLPFALPTFDSARLKRDRTPTGTLAGLLMFAAAIWLGVQNDLFRAFEARLVTPLAGLVIGGGSPVRVNDIVYFGLGTPRRFGLHLTDECTSALLLIPLLVLMGFLAIFTRLKLGRQLVALGVGMLVIVTVNLARMIGIAFSTWEWGFNPGYEYSHVFIGSAFSLIGFVGALLLALWILVRGDRPRSVGALAMTGLQNVSVPDVGAPPIRRRFGHRSRPADADPVVAGPADADLVGADLVGADPNDADPNDADQNDADPGDADPASRGQDPGEPITAGALEQAPSADTRAAREELAELRARWEKDLDHLRDRFDRHLLAAQQGERTAVERNAAMQAALDQAQARTAEAETNLRASQARLAATEAQLDGAREQLMHVAAESEQSAQRRLKMADFEEALADVESRIESVARRLPV